MVQRLEEKREGVAKTYHERKTRLNKAIDEELNKIPEIKNIKAELESYGY